MSATRRYWLYLDDWRTPSQSFHDTGNAAYNYGRWKVVKNYTEFVEYIERGICVHTMWPEVVSLDHDLNDEHYHQCMENPIDYELVQETGWHCLKWLIEYSRKHDLPIPKILVHSVNYCGRVNMADLLKQHGIK